MNRETAVAVPKAATDMMVAEGVNLQSKDCIGAFSSRGLLPALADGVSRGLKKLSVSPFNHLSISVPLMIR
jgi:hypothetical protein